MRKLIALFLIFPASLLAQVHASEWKVLERSRVTDHNDIVTYSDGRFQMVCNEAFKSGDHSLGLSVSCILLPSAPSFEELFHDEEARIRSLQDALDKATRGKLNGR